MFHFLSFEMGHVMLSKKIKGVFGCIYTTEKCGKGPPKLSTIPTNLEKKYQSFHRAMGTYGLDWFRPCFLLCKHTFHHLGNKVSQTPACNVSISHCTVVIPHTSASTAYFSVGGGEV